MNCTSKYWKVYSDTTATIKLYKKSRKIPIGKGVRQGDTISPKLFTACLEEIFKKLEWDDIGLEIDGDYLNNLRFADEIILLSYSGEDLEKMISDLHRESLKVGLKMIMKKTKIMHNKHLIGSQIIIGNEALELVEEYTYLLQMVSANPAHEKEIRRRIGMGWSAFGKQNLVMNSKLALSLKRNVYNQCILSVITYGSEAWRLTKKLERKLRSAQRGMERRMLGITWRDKKRASWIREQTKVEDILMSIKNKKWTWAGHVMRRHDTRWTTKVTKWHPRNGRRNQGRQRVRWRDKIGAFAEPSWTLLTSDRERWRML